MRNIAVIPVKDEPDIETFKASVRHYVDEVVVVQGGTLGHDLRYGLQFGANRDRVVTIDAGGSHDPADIPWMLEQHEDVVIGSRFCPGGHHGGPRSRRWGSRIYGLACVLATGNGIRDWTSGYRVYSPRAVKAILAADITADRHAVQAEMLRAAIQAGCTVTETPIHYQVMPGSTFNRKAAAEAITVWRQMVWR